MRRPSTSVARTFLAAGMMAMAVTACESNTVAGPESQAKPTEGVPIGHPGPATLQVLQFAPDSLVLTQNATGTMQLTGRMSDGTIMPVTGAAFTLSTPGVVSLDTLGNYKSLAPGRTYVFATKGTLQARAFVQVNGPIGQQHINLKPDLLCLRAGYDFQYVLHAYDQAGVEITTPVATTWSTSDASIGTMNASGKLHSTKGGHMIAYGSAMGMTDAKEVIVDPAPIGTPMTCK
jgi:hypothetical protein